MRAGLIILAGFILMSMAGAEVLAKDQSLAAKEALEKRQKVEVMGFFLKDPKNARLPQTTLGIELFNQAVEFYEKKEYDLAKEALEDSLQYYSQNALAYELLGEIAYYQQKLSEAKKNYKKAYELQPRQELKDKIKKLRDESQVERKLSTYKERHFIIKYQRTDQKYDGFELRELLRQTYRDISKEFGFYLKHQVVVLLYDQKEFSNLTKLPHWAAGVYDGKIRMPAYKKGFSDRELKALTAHELTHAFVATIANGRAPAWINEGLAEYMENKVVRVDQRTLQSTLRSGRIFSIDQMITTGSTTSFGDPLKVTLFYEQAYSLVNYMVKRYGMFKVKKILTNLGEGRNSDEAIRRILKITPQKLEKAWLRSIQK